MRLSKMPYVTLWSVRFDETKKLYREILGLKVLEENSNFVMFDTKASRLAFHRLSKGPRVDRPTAELHFEVSDVDEVYGSLMKKGVKLSGVPENNAWGTRVVSFRDPEGYEVEIIGPLKKDDTSDRRSES
jgi:catechol 2,3-dioxygenase-like lactoylglutathione lyase family enzyme